jgi:hypothetical protein
MRKAQEEEITSYVNDRQVNVVNPGPFSGAIKTVHLKRTKTGALILTTTSAGSSPKDKFYPAGTVRQSSDTIEFLFVGGACGCGRGIERQAYNTRQFPEKEAETVETGSLGSIEIDFCRKEKPQFLTEWVGNISSEGRLPDLIDYKRNENSTETIGAGERKLTIVDSAETKSGGRSDTTYPMPPVPRAFNAKAETAKPPKHAAPAPHAPSEPHTPYTHPHTGAPPPASAPTPG